MFSVYEPPTESMQYSKNLTLKYNEIVEIVNQNLGSGYSVFVEVFVKSKKIGVVGKVDAVAINSLEAVPIEVKLNTSPEKLKKIALHHLAQCIAYCIAVEETFKKQVNRFLLVSLEPRAVYEIKVGVALREFIYRISKEIDKMIAEEKMPTQTPSKRKCAACFYRKICIR